MRAPSDGRDSQGILHWDVTLNPKEKREFRISYREYPPVLILEARRKRMAEEAARDNADASEIMQYAAPAKAKSSENIHNQLLDLEAAF